MILASNSPRRREICELLGFTYTVIPAAFEAEPDPSLPLDEAFIQVARGKAEEVAATHPNEVVLGADTVVVVDNQVLGKPKDAADAARMLRLLSGRSHRVMTAVWICDGERSEGFCDTATVTFNEMTDEEIAAYIATNEPNDKAGAYAIQGKGMRYIRGIEGDFYTVMGLPSGRLYDVMKRHT